MDRLTMDEAERIYQDFLSGEIRDRDDIRYACDISARRNGIDYYALLAAVDAIYYAEDQYDR